MSCAIGPSPTNPGDLIVAWGEWQTSGPNTITATATQTQTGKNILSAVGPTVQSASNTAAQIFYVANINNTGETVTLNFSGAVASSACVIVEYSGLDTMYPLDSVSEAISSGAGGYMDSGTASPANANLLVFGGGNADYSTAPYPGSGFSNVQSNSATNNSSITEQYIPSSANNVLQRATACLSATLPCSNAGNWVMQMAIFRAASWTASQGSSSTRLHQILDASQFPGSDIGMQANNAIAALPSFADCTNASTPCGGTVTIPPAPSGGCYSQSTTINIPTSVPVSLIGNGVASCLSYTGSGSAITVNWSGNHYPARLANFMLEGPGHSTSTAGIYIGSSVTDTDQVVIDGVQIGAKSGPGFGVGVTTANAASDITIQNSVVANNGVGIENSSALPMRVLNTLITAYYNAQVWLNSKPK